MAAAPVMKALRQLGFLKISLPSGGPRPEDHRVLDLFRKRAELKKAYGELQEEIYRLKDRVKQQEGATQRVQEMLGTLEGRLASAESGYPALVFYQLRRFWQVGRELIEQFVAELAKQQDERERRAYFAEYNRQRFARRQAVHAEMRSAQTAAQTAREQLLDLQRQKLPLTRFWHYFKRRRLERTIAMAQDSATLADATLVEARSVVEQFENETPLEFPGLSIEARRYINLAAIGCAEALCARLLDTPLVQLARDASARREATDEYGAPAQCERLMQEIERASTKIRLRTHLAQEVKVRVERLKRLARYRSPADTTPVADSINFTEGDALGAKPVGTLARAVPNVLSEDTWDLFRVLLR
jgi:hypothetical protein